MTAELICVGTELLLGDIVNTNAAYLARECAKLGLSVYYQSVVGDNRRRLSSAIRTARKRSDIILLCGGLGPTQDDLTKETAAKVLKRQLVEDAGTKEHIRKFMEQYLRWHPEEKMTENNWKQALVPEGALILENENGTAPGLILEGEGKTAILLPGPPNEIKPMFERDIAPYLNRLQPEGIYSTMVKVCSIGESKAETMVADLMEEQTNPTLAPYAKTGEVHFRVTAKAADEETAGKLMEPMLQELKKRFGNYIFTMDENVTMEESIVDLLKEKQMTVTTAESCTGGLLSGRILNVPGASAVYKEGYITYSNEAKEKLLGVSHETLETYGAVSYETAREMAAGAARSAGADVALAVTGIAGPDGGTKEKPVGLVYIGCFVKGKVRAEEFHFPGNRSKNRDYAVIKALTLLREELLEK